MTDEDTAGHDAGKEAVDQLVQVGEALQRDFHAKQRVLSFENYFKLVGEQPRRHLRDSALYLKDAFDYFGSYDVERARGKLRRFRLFDCEFAQGRDHRIQMNADEGP